MQRPSNKRDIQVFLGMIGYYHQFIPLFSVTAQPLFNLLKHDIPFTWAPDCEKAFVELKSKMIEHPILVFPNFEKEFIVQTDASLNAVGAVLSQLVDKGNEHPIAYCSRTLSAQERNSTVTEKECLEVIYAYKQFWVYLHGYKFIVVTDHASPSWLQNLKEPEGRLARWALKLQPYNFTIVHCPGNTPKCWWTLLITYNFASFAWSQPLI